MKRSAMLALAACVLAVASLSAPASARLQPADTYKPECKKVQEYGYNKDDYKSYDCTKADYDSYYTCCLKPTPAPTPAPTKEPKPEPECYKVETEKYKESDYSDYDCKLVEYGYGYEKKSFYDCCAKPVKPPCKKVEKKDYKPDAYGYEYSEYECTLHEYYYTSYYVCCPKPTPAPTPAPTKEPKPEPKCYKVETEKYKESDYSDYYCKLVEYGYGYQKKSFYDCCVKPVEPPCKKVEKEAYSSYEYSEYECTLHDYHYTSYYVCCPKPTPAPTPAPTKPYDNCKVVQEDDYYKKSNYYKDYECTKVEEPKVHGKDYSYDYKPSYYYKCCPKPTPAPTPVPTKPYDNCKVVKEDDYKKSYYYKDYECTKVEEPKVYGKDYSYDYKPSYYYKCCPKPTPAPTYAPTPKPTKCYTKHYQTCCKVYGKKAKKEYKKGGYSCSSSGRSYEKKYVCCKPLPKPTHPKPVCYTKKFGYKSYKCCYDHEKKYKNDKKYKCFYDSYKGRKGNYCYKKD